MRTGHAPASCPAILLFVAYAAICAPARAQKAPADAAVADPVLIDAQGYKELLARHRGKPVMVNFWATWCEPCRGEYPLVNEVARAFAAEGLVVIGVSFDDDAEMNLVRSFLRKFRPVFPNYRRKAGTEPDVIRAASPNWKGTIPATLFYGRDGKLAAQLVGAQTRASLEKAACALLESSADRK